MDGLRQLPSTYMGRFAAINSGLQGPSGPICCGRRSSTGGSTMGLGTHSLLSRSHSSPASLAGSMRSARNPWRTSSAWGQSQIRW
eukprot:1251181-Pyramimonas_sp.AAC.1